MAKKVLKIVSGKVDKLKTKKLTAADRARQKDLMETLKKMHKADRALGEALAVFLSEIKSTQKPEVQKKMEVSIKELRKK